MVEMSVKVFQWKPIPEEQKDASMKVELIQQKYSMSYLQSLKLIERSQGLTNLRRNLKTESNNSGV